MGMAVVTLKKGEGRLLKSGGMWIFDNEIDTVMGNFENGDIVLVHDFDGYPMGRGFINTNSKITVRLMTRDENVDINEELLEKRVRDAWEYRKKVVDTGCCRLIFAEADFLPGIVVDKFSDVLVVQSLALGIDRFKETIVELLRKVLAEDGITIRGVYERSDVKVRKQEGMEMVKGFIGPEFPTLVQIEENGVKYEVDVKDGQKTGFFLDQKYNRLAFLRCHPPCITQINFVVHSLISNIQCISLFFHKSVHLIYCSRLIVIRSDMHTLYTQTFIIRKELNFGEILFLFLRSFSDCPVKIFPANKIRQANNRNPLEFFLARIIDS